MLTCFSCPYSHLRWQQNVLDSVSVCALTSGELFVRQAGQDHQDHQDLNNQQLKARALPGKLGNLCLSTT